MPRLDADDERRLRRYVDLFNARDFDAVRALIAEDIQLEVVNRTRLRGKAQASTYFGNYDRASDWALSLGFVEGRPAILIRDPQTADGAVRGFMLVEWLDEQVDRDPRFPLRALLRRRCGYPPDRRLDGCPGRVLPSGLLTGRRQDAALGRPVTVAHACPSQRQ